MPIEGIRLRRFKSLYDTEIPLERFSVLTGPNGSGKSNFVAALDFLGEVYSFGVEYAVGRAGGIDAIAYRRRRRTTVPVEFTIRFRLDGMQRRMSLRRSGSNEKDDPVFFEHTFGLRPSDDLSDANFSVAYDNLRIEAIDGGVRQLVIGLHSVDDNGKRTLDVTYAESQGFEELTRFFERRVNEQLELDLGVDSRDSLASTELITDVFRTTPLISDFRIAARQLKAFRLNPSACRRPGVFLPNAALDRDGGNLPGVVERMRRGARASDHRSQRARYRYVAAWDQLMSAMADIFPGLTDISTKINTAGGLDLQISERGVGRPWAANEVSDGTIAYLALLTVMLDTSNQIVLVEEPENALHSWLLRMFVERNREATDRQAIITTHSPVALKAVHPSEVLLSWKRAGRTSIEPLVVVDPSSRALYENEGIDVYEQYDSGFLPETIPANEKAH